MSDGQKLPRKRRKLTVWIVCSIIAVSIFGPLVYSLGTNDSHRTNFRYLKYKYGKAPKDYGWCIHLVTVDHGLLDEMKGKPLDQLRVWLPETGHPKPGSWQDDWLKTMKPELQVTYEVIGNTGWAIVLKNGKFAYIMPLKG